MSSPADESASRSRVKLRGFKRSLPMALLRAREAVMRQFRPSLRQHGITEQQWRILRALSATDKMEVLELASVTFLLAPSVSRILKDLEERGLVVRRSSAADLRRGLISLSPRGQQLIDKAGERSEIIYAEITRRFGQERLQMLYTLLSELEAELAELEELPDLGLKDLPIADTGQRRRGRPKGS
ncbi:MULTISPECIES: homoprotocatechuate degradation operon regulator HpaR [Chelativorans]|jgi:homoprotocatechuate degradation regulator HpaR|uniref:Transcriptional regulator, MarR family n=1 Tax=Chelativorans sp. (strain BNC1) TaxID=266779 RepID=Q11K65_CHESB|nr:MULTISPECIES: homoprotocatechuate degradation operon regulator HpaR [Chelativorans]